MAIKSDGKLHRILSKLGFKQRGDNGRSDLPDIGEDGLLSEPAEASHADWDGDGQSEGRLRQISRWSRRDQAIAQLQEGYEKITHLVEDIQSHLSAQGERSDRICNSLDQLARSMTDLPGITRQQADTLQSIVGQLETTNARSQKLFETLADMPKASQQQTQTLAGIQRQLEVSGEQNVIATQNMEKITSAVVALNQANELQSQALRDMNAKSEQKNDLLNTLIERQNKRFTMLFVVTIILTLLAIGGAAFGVLLFMHNSGALQAG